MPPWPVDLLKMREHIDNEWNSNQLGHKRISMTQDTYFGRGEASLAEGYGYDEHHRGLLGRLQRQRRERRNRPDGYWIAEADPQAARHAVEHTVPRTEIEWAVLATDGAYGALRFLELNDWPRIAHYEHDRLAKLLEQCAIWEMSSDPTGQRHPRFKVTGDKTLAAVIIESP